MPGVYDIGDLVKLTSTFTNYLGQLSDPSNVVLKVHPPSGVVETPSVTHASTGVYFYLYSLTDKESGKYFFRFEGTGGVQAAGESYFRVRQSHVLD